MNILGIIPARYASTRFPAKPLIDIGGKSMIRRVYEQAKKAKLLSNVVVATDNNEIFDHVKSFGGNVVMTKEEHPSGTDRCFEALEKTSGNFDFVINIQGDEPFIHPEQIDLLASALNQETELATLVKKIEDQETLFNHNTPKVIFDKYKEAIYFSRQTIPYIRGAEPEQWLSKAAFYKHIGIYAYRSDILKAITSLETGSLEKSESLEQLRWLENGFKIKVEITTYESVGIDVPSDLEKIKDLI
ncbi:3-deoxy-manno-octulosonate cytidylyltransferase [Sporocytophaga myxococcoides]|uniref:3-deoxy-manno-octulosonate cytidylyltransferase n=1 Tax=Sporocytophaga myxococcoides TaxID=153721 RepID=A0A098LKN4_9BACT|nr:3-deoxy-manno-octulosonate cytidylyltransferase [Sporocytophaga myxococcoides]GAL87049.1 3-deoxy-manno-octulosonate cytidylyltransferase [Sporocytophaga myxococcoides]